MDLKNTINNTNTHKENIKQVATQIDNKLVELGGEQATDLSDVANKMGAMVTGNYKKVAIGDISFQVNTMGDGEATTIDFSNIVNFKIKRVILRIDKIDNFSPHIKYVFLVDSDKLAYVNDNGNIVNEALIGYNFDGGGISSQMFVQEGKFENNKLTLLVRSFPTYTTYTIKAQFIAIGE